MERLWTDGPPTRQQNREQPEVQPPYMPPPPEGPRRTPDPGDRGRSRWFPAIGGGTVSAVVVAAVLLGTGLAGGNKDSPSVAAAPAPPAVTASDRNGDLVRNVYAAASPSVVNVRTQDGTGTGFLVKSDGTIVTNAHVVGNNDQVQVRFADDGASHDAQVLGVDASTDLAVIKVDAGDAQGVKPLQLADSNHVQVGDSAIAIGYPLGLDKTATSGIISGLGREIQSPNGFSIDKVIQTDAPINPGNSGGPLLNAAGQVIGVNSQIATAGGSQGSVGIGFAIPSDTVRSVIPQLEQGQQPQHAFMGLSTAPSPNGDGAQVGEAAPGGPAADAGLTAGDVVTKIDGKAVRSPDDVVSAVNDHKPGDKVSVTYTRNGSEHSVDVTLGQRPNTPATETPTTP